MSAVAVLEPPRRSPAPPLMVIHGGADADAPVAEQPIGLQQELPLTWPLDRHGEALSGQLASYPPLPLQRGVCRPEPYVAGLARLVSDVLVGARPVSQLSRLASLDLCQRLQRRAALRRERGLHSTRPAQVRSTSTMVVGPRAAQAVVVFLHEGRAHGAALRLEHRHNRWILTDVQTPG